MELHPTLQGEWTPARCLSFQEATQIEELCKLLNRLNNPPEVHIKEVNIPLGAAIAFHDGSGIRMTDKEATKFLNDYIADLQQRFNIMEYNRQSDPRVTGEFNRLQRIESNADQALSCLRRLKGECEAGNISQSVFAKDPDLLKAIEYLEGT